MLTKSELKTLWRETNFRPLKRLGQNFLIERNVKDKILRNLELDKDDIVLEIGAGFGELTFGLAERAKKVFAVEKDKKIVEILKRNFEMPHNVHLIEKDFLSLDISEIALHQKIIVYGNLPYYITTPIVEKIFDNIALIKDVYFIVQKEVGDRILAQPGSKEMGRLTLYVQYYAEPRRIFKIGKGSFYPNPQVDSVLLRLGIPRRRRIQVKNEKFFFEIIKKAYNQRRKTILNSLSGKEFKKDLLLNLLKKAEIDPSVRVEELSLQDFARLADILIIADILIN